VLPAFVEPITKTAIPIPPLPLRIRRWSCRPRRRCQSLLRNTATRTRRSGGVGHRRRQTSIGHRDGEIDSIRYGNVLRARKLVMCAAPACLTTARTTLSVTHTISRSDYKQSFSVSREGTGALLPVVQP
jgi:hypothetical protein